MSPDPQARMRLATEVDRLTVEGIVNEAYRKYVSRIGREPGPMLDDYAALIEAGKVHVLDQDGTIQGLLVLIPESDALLLDNVAVRPGLQGLGLGRRLLDFAQRTARAAGYRTIRLYTHELMTENIAIYAGMGFVETHRAEEKGLRRVFMSKRIPD